MENNEIKKSANYGNNMRISVGTSQNTYAGNIKISNNDVEYYEKQAEKFAAQAKEYSLVCSKYVSESKKSVSDCENVAEELKDNFDADLNLHRDNTNNPHKVTAEQLNVYTKTETDGKYLTEHQDISGKADKAEIPTKVSELANDSGYLTKIPDEYVTETELTTKGYLTSIPESYARKTDIPDVSQKADKAEIPTKVSELINDSGYLTTHQDVSGKVDKSELAKVALSGSYNDLSDKPVIPEGATVDTILSETSNNSVANRVVTKALKTKQDVISDIDTIRANANLIASKQDKITDLDAIRNGANLGATALQSVPTEYVTETELTAKGYLTEHQDISGKADLNLKNCTVPYIKEIYTKDGNGYILYSNDVCKQWGRLKKDSAIAKTSAWNSTVTLPKSYNNTDYSIIVSCNYGTGTASNAGSEVGTGEMKSSSFAFCMYNRNSSATAKTIELNWCTIGVITSAGQSTNEGGFIGPPDDDDPAW